jgi:F420-dependent methylenetetrahydromethanopterin dehydrogenase
MRRSCLALALAALAATVTVAQTPAAAVDAESAAAQPALDDLLWVSRPLVVFADTPNDPRLQQQLRLLSERPEDLTDRDVVVLTDSAPDEAGPLREELRPRGFGVVLIDKDGMVVRRFPTPVSAREIVNQIDRLPSRREETGSRRP